MTAATDSADKPAITLGSRSQRSISKAILLEEAGIPAYVKGTVVLIVATIAVFLVWASVARLDEVAATTGEIVPSDSVQIIQHQDGGTIARIFVQEGQKITAGTVLLSLNRAEAEADLEQANARYWGLFARAERLRAFAEFREPDFAKVPPQYAHLVDDQRVIMRSHLQSENDQAAIVRAQVAQAQADLARIDGQMTTTRNELQVLRELSSIRNDLQQEKLVTRTQALDTQRSVIVAEGELRRLSEQRQVTLHNIEELKTRLASVASDRRQTAVDEMGVAASEMAQVAELINKLQERLTRTDIRAPVDGIVQDLKYRTNGGVITPGATVMRLVPTDDVVQAEVRISTDDVGHVSVGQRARVKVSTFDFMRYGAIEGEVRSISATSFFDEQNRPYFKGVVQLQKSELGGHPIMPGMTVVCDVVTNEKTVLQYLLRPIALAVGEGMRER